MNIDGTTQRFRGTVSCFTIDGTDARISVKVERSENPNVRPGDYLTFTVQDNNQPFTRKAKKTPDQTSFFFLADSALAQHHCDFGLNLTMYPVQKGQIELFPEPTLTE
jgi:hypothetical protein